MRSIKEVLITGLYVCICACLSYSIMRWQNGGENKGAIYTQTRAPPIQWWDAKTLVDTDSQQWVLGEQRLTLMTLWPSWSFWWPWWLWWPWWPCWHIEMGLSHWDSTWFWETLWHPSVLQSLVCLWFMRPLCLWILRFWSVLLDQFESRHMGLSSWQIYWATNC